MPVSPTTPPAPVTPGGPEAPSEPDRTESFLDDAFERAIEALQRGDRPSPDALSLGRPDLRTQVEELIGAAARVVAREPAVRPAVREVPGYRLIGELGRGGMGVVHRAQQISVADREVALKVLPAGALGGGVARFTQESRAIARLKHPSIIAIHDVIASADGPSAIAMELIDGPSLSRLIARLSAGESSPGPASRSDRSSSGKRSASAPALMERAREVLGTPPDAAGASPALGASYPVFVCGVGAALARALDAVHRAGLVHRDVKPGNVLLRRDGTPVLTDFGLARDLSSAPEATMHTQTGAFVGTAAYAPPEQVRGEHDRVDARSDVYSLGATLFHTLTLRPMPARSATEALRFFERGASLPPLRKIDPRLPRDLETIVAKATDPEPARRYQSAAEFADDLERVLTLRPIRARPAGALEHGWRAVRRNRRTVLVAVASVGLTLALVSAAVAWVSVLPRWAAREVREARLALLDQRQGGMLWVIGFHEIPFSDSTSSIASLNESLHHYASALFYQPTDAAVARERAVVALARDLLLGNSDNVARSAPRLGLPRLADYARVRATTGPGGSPSEMLALPLDNDPRLGPEQEELAAADLRAVGLLAYLTRDMGTAVGAWSRVDAMGRADALVNSALGILFLVTDQPQRAYPRLEFAARELPGVGFLTVYHADAARACGDLVKARRLLDQASAMPGLDSSRGLSRVVADLEADSGNTELAERLFREVIDYGHNSVAPFHYARWLARRGERERALAAYADGLTSHEIGAGRLRREFVQLTDRWWDELENAAQAQAVSDPPSPPWVGKVRTQYLTSVEMIGLPSGAFVAP